MTDQDPTPPRGTPRLLLTAEQAAAALSIGRTNTYALIKSGELRSLLIGRLRRIPLDEVEAYTARLMAQQHPVTGQEGVPRGGCRSCVTEPAIRTSTDQAQPRFRTDPEHRR
jgi:excisionase family DNA binding protein